MLPDYEYKHYYDELCDYLKMPWYRWTSVLKTVANAKSVTRLYAPSAATAYNATVPNVGVHFAMIVWKVLETVSFVLI